MLVPNCPVLQGLVEHLLATWSLAFQAIRDNRFPALCRQIQRALRGRGADVNYIWPRLIQEVLEISAYDASIAPLLLSFPGLRFVFIAEPEDLNIRHRL